MFLGLFGVHSDPILVWGQDDPNWLIVHNAVGDRYFFKNPCILLQESFSVVDIFVLIYIYDNHMQ